MAPTKGLEEGPILETGLLESDAQSCQTLAVTKLEKAHFSN
jgi:hypothetical protein